MANCAHTICVCSSSASGLVSHAPRTKTAGWHMQSQEACLRNADGPPRHNAQKKAEAQMLMHLGFRLYTLDSNRYRILSAALTRRSSALMARWARNVKTKAAMGQTLAHDGLNFTSAVPGINISAYAAYMAYHPTRSIMLNQQNRACRRRLEYLKIAYKSTAADNSKTTKSGHVAKLRVPVKLTSHKLYSCASSKPSTEKTPISMQRQTTHNTTATSK